MSTDEEAARVFVCAGPPHCQLEGDEAVAEQQKGCALCTIYVFRPGEPEEIIKPNMTKQ